ncbi:hypothetical protein ACFPU0_20820 [Pseudomonas sp. GCM10022186]|uniref:hypothetical protein n=1 Tax=Pseudomonas sp. GCM10022186 TaxID=3252650 RepID=UPI003616175E
MKRFLVLLGLLISSFTTMGADMSNGADNFYKSDKVTRFFQDNLQLPEHGEALDEYPGK